MTDILAAAEAIASNRRDRTLLRPLGADVAPQDEAAGYRIQDALHELLAADFGALVGQGIDPANTHLKAWFDRVAGRAPIKADPVSPPAGAAARA